MKKINPAAILSLCIAYMLIYLFLPTGGYGKPEVMDIVLYIDMILNMLPYVLLVLFLFVFQKNRETGIITSLGCILISLTLYSAINVTVKGFDPPEYNSYTGTYRSQFDENDYLAMGYNGLWLIIFLVAGIVLLKRREFQNMRQVFLLFSVLALMNIIVTLKIAFFEDAYLPLTKAAPNDSYNDGSYPQYDSSGSYSYDSVQPLSTDTSGY